jgi:hypothetical protein
VAAVRQRDVGSSMAAAWRQCQRQRWWRQCNSAKSAVVVARQRNVQSGGGGSVSGGGGSAKRGSGAQRDGGSAFAAARMLQRWQQVNSATLAAA